eukprot:TRINITY_DN4542_c0_g1_i1.p1 TRINITY_DN4542_c0_g1~~TRINITY_DN4542_c0_g1_i1.p1  ORF type:complete len:141 (+),score=56.83 TRINITY_DN4542_c0_g1_i1:56-478(+)
MFRTVGRNMLRAQGWGLRWASVSGIEGIEKITYVKKIKMDGSMCKKCGEVTERLENAGQMKQIDAVAVADERDENSEGMLIASKHNVERAPFFVVEKADGSTEIYTIYFDFVKKVLKGKASESQALKDTMEQNRDVLDMI